MSLKWLPIFILFIAIGYCDDIMENTSFSNGTCLLPAGPINITGSTLTVNDTGVFINDTSYYLWDVNCTFEAWLDIGTTFSNGTCFLSLSFILDITNRTLITNDTGVYNNDTEVFNWATDCPPYVPTAIEYGVVILMFSLPVIWLLFIPKRKTKKGDMDA